MEYNRLYNTIESWYGRRTCEDLKTFFDKTGITPPRAQDYQVLYNNEGYLFFLNQVALSCKITKKHVRHIKNDYILQPIASHDIRSFRVELFSGLECPVKKKDLKKLKKILGTYDIFMHDAQTLNAGYLPHKTQEFPNGVPVVLDIGAVYQEVDSNAIFNKDAEKTPIQNHLYGDLKKSFNDAFCAKTSRRCKAILNETWKQCAYLKNDNKLTASWLTANHAATRHRGIAAQSLSYEARMQPYFETIL